VITATKTVPPPPWVLSVLYRGGGGTCAVDLGMVELGF